MKKSNGCAGLLTLCFLGALTPVHAEDRWDRLKKEPVPEQVTMTKPLAITPMGWQPVVVADEENAGKFPPIPLVRKAEPLPVNTAPGTRAVVPTRRPNEPLPLSSTVPSVIPKAVPTTVPSKMAATTTTPVSQPVPVPVAPVKAPVPVASVNEPVTMPTIIPINGTALEATAKVTIERTQTAPAQDEPSPTPLPAPKPLPASEKTEDPNVEHPQLERPIATTPPARESVTPTLIQQQTPKVLRRPSELLEASAQQDPTNFSRPLENRPNESGVMTLPKPTPEDLAEYSQFVKTILDPRNSFDIIVGRSRIMVLNVVPKRVQLDNEEIVGKPLVITPTELSLSGKKIGSTVLTLYFDDPSMPGKERILSYVVRVIRDPIAQESRKRNFKELTDEINQAFPDSVVEVKLVGDKVVLMGQAKDIEEASHILRIVQASVTETTGDRQFQRNNQLQAVTYGFRSVGDDQILTASEQLVGPEVVNLLRVPGEHQVMLQVNVAEVNRSAARSIGINFSYTNNAGVTVLRQNTGSLISDLAQNTTNALGASQSANILAAIDNGQLRLAIEALRNVNLARSLAEPNLTTLNGRTANFQAGGQFPVPVLSGAQGFQNGIQGVQFVPFGVSLQFTPTIMDKDRIRLQLAAEVSARDVGAGQTNFGGAGVPSLTTRNFSSTVEMRDGETIAIAGLIQNNFGADAARVPFLGDIPVLGRVFGRDSTTCAEQELVVLITPRLVHPMRGDIPPLPGSDMVSPDDIEFYLQGRLTSQGGPAKKHHRRASIAVERQCLSGPYGYSDGSVPTSSESMHQPTGR